MEKAEENPYASPLSVETLSDESKIYIAERRWKMVKVLAPVVAVGGIILVGIGMGASITTDFKHENIIVPVTGVIAVAGTFILGLAAEGVDSILAKIRERIKVFEQSR